MNHILILVMASAILTQCSPSEKNISPSDLEGNWTLIKTEIIEEKQSIAKYKERSERLDDQPLYVNLTNGKLRPNSPDYLKRRLDLVFSGDSTFRLYYPLERQENSFYTIEANFLKIGNDLKGKPVVLGSDKDTMRISYLDEYGLYLKETYQKVTFNDSILNILALYKINYPLLAGKWSLMRVYDDNHGGHYPLDFPFDIPDTLLVKEEDFTATFYKDRSFYMLTNGKKRKYFLKYYYGDLRLIPDDWYKEEDPYIRFKRGAGQIVPTIE